MANKWGPYPSAGSGQQWDDKINDHVDKITVYTTEDGMEIISIQFEYTTGGKKVTPDMHGGEGGLRGPVMQLEPTEYLTSVSGYYGSVAGPRDVVQSLKFKSNLQSIEYGKEKSGTPFGSPLPGKTIGFFGRNSDRVDAIGGYLK